ncbi:MAG: 3-hydroxyacyl-CoA dehydrogenase NAD-binding domain-containing protein [Thermaurantimonas sp.]|uniref:3-hydroxyacyl-CoA dehydrogenase NAD-binding domain-containing protein n=1 Tax=Thermaurantimonas sp. TaxID=2681568 RepID=UPI00391B8A1A
MKINSIGIAGAGTMGIGIAQLAAQKGYNVLFYDIHQSNLDKAKKIIEDNLVKLTEKGKLNNISSLEIIKRIHYTDQLKNLSDSSLLIEAIVENFEAKKTLFSQIEKVVSDTCIIASNTSSLSINRLSSVFTRPERFIGLHFFNPATIMKLVEIIPGINTSMTIVDSLKDLMKNWGKVPALAKDTPGFIVNRVARPFYGEALRIAEEGLATPAEIDHIMKTLGGFRMGPFELMDFIGLDVNFSVSYSVFEQLYYDPRYRPSLLQQRMMESGRLGRKVGKGFYDYSLPNPFELSQAPDESKSHAIFFRILSMLINEAVDAVYLQIADAQAVDEAMMYGANYPKGLIAWGKEIGFEKVKAEIDRLFEYYKDMRYRASAGFYVIDRLLN